MRELNRYIIAHGALRVNVAGAFFVALQIYGLG